MLNVIIAVLFLIAVALLGYGVGKATGLHLSAGWSAALTIIAVFLFGFAEGID